MTAPSLAGYVRADGRVGFRNHLLVLPAHAAAGAAVREIARGLPSAVTIAHDWDPDPADGDHDRVRRTLVNFCRSPNVGAVVVVGVGDDELAELVAASGQRVESVLLAEQGGTRGAAARAVARARPLLAALAAERRTPVPLSSLCVGLECGGSDALSGITANPALGVATDLVVGAGGAAILGEIPELIGAEHLLAARARTPAVRDAFLGLVRRFEDEIAGFGVDIRGGQPTPGNIEGGLSTLEEKSLGAAKKGGSAPLAGVLEFAERVSAPGLHVMDTPGHDIEQMVGMVAGGAQVVVFTTGRGTPTGSPVAPCLKVSSNTDVARRMGGDVDLDAGTILAGEPLRAVGERIFAAIVEVANGRPTASELHGHREFALSRLPGRPGSQRSG